MKLEDAPVELTNGPEAPTSAMQRLSRARVSSNNASPRLDDALASSTDALVDHKSRVVKVTMTSVKLIIAVVRPTKRV